MSQGEDRTEDRFRQHVDGVIFAHYGQLLRSERYSLFARDSEALALLPLRRRPRRGRTIVPAAVLSGLSSWLILDRVASWLAGATAACRVHVTLAQEEELPLGSVEERTGEQVAVGHGSGVDYRASRRSLADEGDCSALDGDWESECWAVGEAEGEQEDGEELDGVDGDHGWRCVAVIRIVVAVSVSD